MPFPADRQQLEATGHTFNRSEVCPVCGEPVEIWITPGKREIQMNPMILLDRPAIRHYESCNIAPTPPAPIKMYGVRDKNMLAVGWAEGVLQCAFHGGTYQYSGVAEDAYAKIKANPYPYALFCKLARNHPELYPVVKVA